ncbi:MAG: hypothetical protein C0506_13370 [Anaerolinea sp.]|nr:hypothetical protein [Anaerolinea sp.]
MAKVMILSRSRDRWVGWQMEPTKFKANMPAHEVLERIANEHPEMMVAIASHLLPLMNEPDGKVTQLPLPAFLAS